ncbi:hypothetical protein P3X46_002719 [Hevea brasiliensis]|uniref:R13L1/DRL21-like LRR repeat region domain-containing protein n=2 Tax=Hevea brasiliensis TaxID=3981 RepID=A0ABQ9N3X8_HEVBR|nr:hypothetical protein P3X46_002719 [Hevea brasiliensis]
MVAEGHNKIQELECLNELRRKLLISNLEQVRDKKKAVKAKLQSKTKIYALVFVWSSERDSSKNDEDVLEGLLPPQSIKSLKIVNYVGEKFPSWMLMNIPDHGNSLILNNLVKLKLEGCRKCEQLMRLGHLPCLEILEIDEMSNVSFIGNEFYGIEGGYQNSGWWETMQLFPSLKEFYLCSMESLVEWLAPAVGGGSTFVFPSLNVLIIYGCPQLRSIPIRCLSSLVKLKISFCDELDYLSDFLGFTLLEDLTIQCCKNLVAIPSVQFLASLRRLSINCCDRLKLLPTGLHSCSSLEYLSITGCKPMFLMVYKNCPLLFI